MRSLRRPGVLEAGGRAVPDDVDGYRVVVLRRGCRTTAAPDWKPANRTAESCSGGRVASVAEWVEGARHGHFRRRSRPWSRAWGVTGHTGTDLSAMHVAVAALLALLVALAPQIRSTIRDYSDGKSAAPTASGRPGPARGTGLPPASQVKRAALLRPGDRGCSGDRPGAGQPAVGSCYPSEWACWRPTHTPAANTLTGTSPWGRVCLHLRPSSSCANHPRSDRRWARPVGPC